MQTGRISVESTADEYDAFNNIRKSVLNKNMISQEMRMCLEIEIGMCLLIHFC